MVSLTSASTLATLQRTGPRRITDLAAIEGVTQSAMTVLVQVLERSGLVERGGDPADKRVTLVAITESGADYVRARRHAGAEAFVALIDELPAGEATALLAAVPALQHLRRPETGNGNLRADPPAGGQLPPDLGRTSFPASAPAEIDVADVVTEQLALVRTPSGVRLASEVSRTADGSGAIPVVFLHATGFSRGVWRPVARLLADVAPGIALDLRGHGDSDKPDPPYYWPLLVEDVTAYVQQLPAERVVLCGHSLGGATAVEVAARIPDRVAALALVEPALSPTPNPNQRVLVTMTLRRTHSWPSQAAAEQHIAVRSPYCYWDHEVLTGYFATGLTLAGDGGCTLSCPPQIEASLYAEVGTSQAWSRLSQITCPTWVLRGASDRGMPSTASPLIAQVAPDSVHRLAEESGHFVPMEQPGLVAAFIREMLATLQHPR
jgi:pimeloyl-ACP methyl ester carboxylesterase/DNA-binding MarR family transcriptional regulator